MVLIFNDIGGGEVILILLFILIFFGAKSIPGLARTFGRTIRQIKDASADLQSEIKKSGSDITKDLNLKELIDDTERDIRRPLDQYAADIEDVMKRTPTNSMPQQRKSVEAAPPAEAPEAAGTPETPQSPPKAVDPVKEPKVEIKTPPVPKPNKAGDSE